MLSTSQALAEFHKTSQCYPLEVLPLRSSSLSTLTVLSTVSPHLQLLTVRRLGSHPHSRTRREIEKATVNVEIDLALLKLPSLHRGSGLY